MQYCLYCGKCGSWIEYAACFFELLIYIHFLGHAFSFAWDQFDNAARVAAPGVGMVTPATHAAMAGLPRPVEMAAKYKATYAG